MSRLKALKMYRGIEHTAIASPDPEALASWYEQTLNFPIDHRVGSNVFLKAPDGTMLEIIPSEGERLNTTPKTPGVRHFAVTVDDFDAALEDLRGKGVDLDDPATVQGIRVAYFRDPEGNLLHLVRRPDPA